MFWISTAVFVVLMGLPAADIARGRRARVDASAPRMAGPINQAETDPPLTRAVSIGVALTVVILFALLVATVWVGMGYGDQMSRLLYNALRMTRILVLFAVLFAASIGSALQSPAPAMQAALLRRFRAWVRG